MVIGTSVIPDATLGMTRTQKLLDCEPAELSYWTITHANQGLKIS